MTADELPPVLTLRQACAYLQVCYETGLSWCHAGKLPGATKVVGHWRVPRSAIPAALLPPAPAPVPETAAERKARARRASERIKAIRVRSC